MVASQNSNLNTTEQGVKSRQLPLTPMTDSYINTSNQVGQSRQVVQHH